MDGYRNIHSDILANTATESNTDADTKPNAHPTDSNPATDNRECAASVCLVHAKPASANQHSDHRGFCHRAPSAGKQHAATSDTNSRAKCHTGRRHIGWVSV